jgi:hypothetical protein
VPIIIIGGYLTPIILRRGKSNEYYGENIRINREIK